MDIKKNWRNYALYSGIAGSIVFVIGTIIAMVTYPNYSVSGNFFSDTGLRVDSESIIDGRMIRAHPYPYIFSITLFITATLLLPFYISIPIIMNSKENKSVISKILYWFYTALGLFIIPSTIAVGIYDWGYNLGKHVIAAQTTLAGILLFVLTWMIADIFLNKDHPYKVKSQILRDFGVSIFIIICSYTQIGLLVPNIMTIYIPLQIYQKTAIYSALIYLAVIAKRLNSMISNPAVSINQNTEKM